MRTQRAFYYPKGYYWGNSAMAAVKKQKQSGFAMIMALICMTILTLLAVSMASVSSTGIRISDNKRTADKALNAAQSGIEIMKYWLNGLNAESGTGCLESLTSELGSSLSSAGVTNINCSYSSGQIDIPAVLLMTDNSFSAVITQINDNTVRLRVLGTSGHITRPVTVDFNIVSRGNSVFDYGVASKGPLQMSGQSEISSVNLAVESSVYIDGQLSTDAFSITCRASVAGDVYICDEYATYSLGHMASVGGESGDDAEDHIIIGAPSSTFPVPDPSYFESFATGETIDSTTPINNNAVLNNVTITAGTNPIFSGNVTINGVLYIETPNVVVFAGQATVTGIIVGDGIVGDSSSLNRLVFSGQVDCYDVSRLEGAEFDAIKQETGTFILAPGFSVDFSGQTTVDNGAIAASGIRFTGQAGGTIHGSIINYSTAPVVMSGQSTLLFNRSGTETNPAGFGPVKELHYAASSYAEPLS